MTEFADKPQTTLEEAVADIQERLTGQTSDNDSVQDLADKLREEDDRADLTADEALALESIKRRFEDAT